MQHSDCRMTRRIFKLLSESHLLVCVDVYVDRLRLQHSSEGFDVPHHAGPHGVGVSGHLGPDQAAELVIHRELVRHTPTQADPGNVGQPESS